MFQKAQIQGSYLRAAIFGPPGGGKTYSALRMATGIVRVNPFNGGQIFVIDSERGRAKKYANQFGFQVCELNENTIDEYIKAIQYAAGKCAVLIIDSISHAWKALLAAVDAAVAKGKNSFQAWGKVSITQEQFTELLMRFPGHVICTMRSAIEYEITTTDSGKMKPVRLGLKPVQGKEIEYEFDVLMQMAADHSATIVKDNSGKFQDKIVELPGEDFGIALANWLMGRGQMPEIAMRPISPPTPALAIPTPPQIALPNSPTNGPIVRF